MNKYQKALMETESLYINKYNNGKIDEDKFNEIIKPLKELVDRATPKKPNKMTYKMLVADGWEYQCPICECAIGLNVKSQRFTDEYPYCDSCGQALDWEDTDESQPNELDNMFADSLKMFDKLGEKK